MVIRKPGDARASEVSGTAGRLARLEKAVGMQKDRAAKIVLSFRAYYGGDEIPDPEPGESARLFIADFGDEGHNEKQIE